MGSAAAPGPATCTPRRRLAGLVAGAAMALIVGAACVFAFIALLTTEAGLRAAVMLVQRIAPLPIAVEGIHGALDREFGVDRIELVAGHSTVEIVRLRARIDDLSFAPPELRFKTLTADRVRITVTRAAEPQTEPPQSIASPLALKTARLAIGELELHLGAASVALRAIDSQVAIGTEGYRVDQGRFELAGNAISVDGRLAAERPFALQAHGRVGAALADHAVQATWRAHGSLLDLVVATELSGGGARGHAKATLAPFAEPPLKTLEADIDGFVPRAWNAAWPAARLRLRASLTPGAAGDTLVGPINVVNHEPGTLDAGRLPVREAAAHLALSRRALRADALHAALLRGSASGAVSLQWGAAPRWQAQLRLDAVDPAAIHAAARSMAIDGRVNLHDENGSTAIRAELHHRGTPAVDARLAMRIDASQADVEAADLTLGEGRLVLRGAVGLAGDKRIALDGTVERFNPGLLVKGVDALVNGKLHLDAQLAPPAQGRLHFELRDSHAFGRPLTGHGDVQLDARRRAEVDLALALRSARLVAQGGLGGPDRSLKVTLDAPALDELLPGVRGAVTLEATAAGAWDAPALDARLAAQGLAAGTQSVREAQVQLKYSGGSDGHVDLHADLADHRFGDRAAWSLRTATLAVEGALSTQRIALQATSAVGRKLTLGAEGGFSAQRWRGSLRVLRLDGAPGLALAAAAPLTIGADGFDLGPLAIDAAGARFDALRIGTAAGTWRTAGRFTGLRPQPLLALALDSPIGTAPPAAEALKLRGEWQLALGAQADGRLVVERSSGDLLTASANGGGIGLRELRIAATLDANRLAAEAHVASARGGLAEARLAAFVARDDAAGWRLAPARAWRLDASAESPSVGQLQAAFTDAIGHAWRVDGRLTAQLHLDGTPTAMRSSGSIAGEDLRVAWIEGGMRLEQGTLAARLADDALIVDRLRFVTTTRGVPRDPRASARLPAGTGGTLEASGRIGLRDGAGEIRLSADKLALLQRPDRWVVASGKASLAAARDGARLEGDIAVDAGTIEVKRSPLPTLSGDVTVQRRGAATATRASRYPFGFDLGIDLGPALRVKASGLDARAEGTIRLRGHARTGGVVATGTIQTDDGRYEGFGQRLAIKRGRLNFQGNPENPALDVLAVREGLPVDVGVTVTRNVANPLVRLYSDPPLADPEILSWLLYGHAGDQTSADNVALLQAAAGALSGSEEGIANRLARSLGLDDFTLRTGELRGAGSLLPQSAVAGDLRTDRSVTPGAANGIVSIGKRIGEAITISYEQAVAGTESVVQLTYRLSQRLYLVARAGTASAFELVYSRAFD